MSFLINGPRSASYGLPMNPDAPLPLAVFPSRSEIVSQILCQIIGARLSKP